jgi:hypothetical protein
VGPDVAELESLLLIVAIGLRGGALVLIFTLAVVVQLLIGAARRLVLVPALIVLIQMLIIVTLPVLR